MRETVGIVETRGFAAAVEAADAMTKSAAVRIADFQFVGSGLVSVVVTGEVAAVATAVEAGRIQASRVGEVFSSNVIPRPHEEMDKFFGEGSE